MSVAYAALTRRRAWWVRSRAWLGISIIAPFAVATLCSPPYFREGSWADTSVDAVGWVLFVLGGICRWWATLYIGGRKLEAVVDEGPYSVCRNPLYLGTFLMSLAVAVFLQSFTFALGLAFASVFYLNVTVSAEEVMLEDKFGQPYREYLSRVPRFFPNLRLFRTSNTIIVNPGGLWSEGRRMLRWIWLPIICELVNNLRVETWWPHPWRMP